MKNNRLFHLIALVVFFLFLCPMNVLAKDKLTWLITHWPPIMELDEAKENIIGGQYGEQLKLLQADLHDYQHVNKEMKWNRFWNIVKKGEHVCNSVAYKNDARVEFTEFSIPITIILPNHIIMKNETAKMLGNPKSLSLVELMQNKQLKGGVLANRSYSSDIDTLLKKHEKGSNISRHVIDEESSIKMLYNKRMDYILEYPFAVNHMVDKYIPDYKGAFTYIPIKEIAKFSYVYVACPKNEWGKTLVGKINESLKKLRPTKEFRQKMEFMYAGENLETVWKYYDEELVNANK